MEARDETDAESVEDVRRASSLARRRWALTQEAFDKLLACLDPDREAAGVKYLEVRRNLTRFFEWRGCPFPEDHADETINRVAKRVSEGEEIRNPSAYFLGAARMLLLEIHKERAREHQAIAELTIDGAKRYEYEFEEIEPRVECLRRCLKSLSEQERELILQYYHGEKSAKIEARKRLSERLGTSLNTLRMRALRLREKLFLCVADCLKK